ncbi:hypothetical protein KORDIASMS9_03523 [Kordia sp. SMS9]|uniref:hypothetical protein n=1 Tax=Kordia sp. SMS9 TaxID=2282170 RepID=UPI000E0DF742|nr:hypothetical protein [Kordia sp. SMS9]AXG71266.1 hypothetical protein KORDIASMS9_03523 [Kordia sp. SMS9]
MKSEKLKKIQLNKRAISNLSENRVTGGNPTFTTTLDTFQSITVCSLCCADTIDDHTCTLCTIA